MKTRENAAIVKKVKRRVPLRENRFFLTPLFWLRIFAKTQQKTFYNLSLFPQIFSFFFLVHTNHKQLKEARKKIFFLVVITKRQQQIITKPKKSSKEISQENQENLINLDTLENLRCNGR